MDHIKYLPVRNHLIGSVHYVKLFALVKRIKYMPVHLLSIVSVLTVLHNALVLLQKPPFVLKLLIVYVPKLLAPVLMVLLLQELHVLHTVTTFVRLAIMDINFMGLHV